LKILCIASEAAPYVKTGGLGDVMGALPRALAGLGHDVRIVLPFYSQINPEIYRTELLMDRIEIWLPAGGKTVSVWQLHDPKNPIPVYLIKSDELFDRPSLYDEGGREYADNPLRFAYFCLSVFWMLKGLQWFPDIFHCHDWQAGMVPTYLKNLEVLKNDPDFAHSKTLLTIHNLAYQGACSPEFLPLIGLPQRLFNLKELEFFGKLNLLKGGIVYSDRLSTVSRRYAGEIQTADFGCGLEGILRARSKHLHGIMNGIDTDVWNPETDPYIPAHYDAENPSGKEACKAELQSRFGLPVNPHAPVAGIVSRLVEQKGLDLISETIHPIIEMGIQFVLLGTGMEKYQRYFRLLAKNHPSQMYVEIGYNEPAAHFIEAGCDMLLMPSRFEPCGLTQLYSMRYGTVPIVRQTGGLADSVENSTKPKILSGEATGFTFVDYTPDALLGAVKRAEAVYHDSAEPDLWQHLILNGMSRDHSWHHSAQLYEKLMLEMLK